MTRKIEVSDATKGGGKLPPTPLQSVNRFYVDADAQCKASLYLIGPEKP
jgi:hypothetical protein